MRLRQPRIRPVADDELTDEQKAILDGFHPVAQNLNLFRTILRYPEAFKALVSWGNYIQSKKNSLQGRRKEIVILRTAFQGKAAYEWSHHSNIGRTAGLSEEEIRAIKLDPERRAWAPDEKILLHAVDELMANDFISNATWSELARHFSEKELMDIVLTSGHYAQVGRIVNAFGIQLDEGTPRDEDLIEYV